MKKIYSFLWIASSAMILTILLNIDRAVKHERESQSIKDYYEFLLARQAGPGGIVDPMDVEKVERQITQLNSVNYKNNATSLVWQEMGPDNVGGRTLGILVDNKHDGWIYAGAASGGIWLSKTGGTSWYHIGNNSDFYENLCVSSITQTPDGDIYFGTGEGSFGGLRGGGVWRKDKDSTEFKRLNKTNPSVGGSNWNNTNFMAASAKRDRIYAGNEGGLYVSDDDGNSWTRANGTVAGNCTEVKADADGTVAAIINKKVYLSTNDGDAFVLSATGLPNVGSVGRSTIAISSKNTNYIYIVYAKANTNDCYAAYRTTDKGVSWQLIQLGNAYFNPFNDQGWYDICSAVDPENEDHVFVGGVYFWEWDGPGTNFIRSNYQMHPDLHNITIDAHTHPYTIILGTDGGIFKSYDKGKTFGPSLKLYTTTQFYSMSASRADNVVGGTQDNGTLYIDKNGNTVKSGYNILGGDGFFSETAWHDPYEVKFAESQYANLRRNKANSAMQPFYDDSALLYIADASGKFSGSGGNGQFSSPFTLWEHPTDDSIAYFAIGVRGAIYFTKGAMNFSGSSGPQWFKLASFNGSVNCVEFSADGDMLFFGVGNAVYRISGINTATFEGNFNTNQAGHGIKFNALPFNSLGTSVEGITCDLKNTSRLLITTGNYGFNDHVFISHNADDIYSNVKFQSIQKNLPAFPCYDAAFDYLDTNTILVGTEYGLYATFNNGNTWSEQNSGMSRVPVYQVRQYIDTRQPWTGSMYYLATFGRGIFKSASLTTGIKPVYSKTMHEFSVYPNPAINSLTVNGLYDGKVNVYNASGTCVLSTWLFPDKSVDISQLPKGIYFFELRVQDRILTTKFLKI